MAGTTLTSGTSRESGSSSALTSIVALALLAVLSVPLLFTAPLLLLGVAVLPFLSLLTRPAVPYLLLFVAFSFFRLHEAYPFLAPFSLPLLLGAAGIGSFAYTALEASAAARKPSSWQWPALFSTIAAAIITVGLIDPLSPPNLVQRAATFGLAVFASLSIYSWFRWLEDIDGRKWGGEMKAFCALFILLTLGLPLARELPEAQWYWLVTYWKIAATTLALAWLLREQKQLEIAILSVIASGFLVSLVVIYNGLNGIDLVEGTRVTIGGAAIGIDPNTGEAIKRGFILGDPNDLALVLLFPFGFAAGVVVKPGMPRLVRLLSFAALATIFVAIVYTQSRGGALGMLAVLGAIMLSSIKSRILVTGILGSAAVVLFLAMAIGARQSGGAAEIATAGIDASAEGRIHAWTAAIRMALRFPLTGVGINNFMGHFFEYTPVWLGQNKAVHSTWFAILAEGGFPGLIVFVLICWRSFRALTGLKPTIIAAPELQKLEPIRLGLLAALAGFVVSSSFLTQHIGWPLYIQIAVAASLVRYVQAYVLKAAQPAGTGDGQPGRGAARATVLRPAAL